MPQRPLLYHRLGSHMLLSPRVYIPQRPHPYTTQPHIITHPCLPCCPFCLFAVVPLDLPVLKTRKTPWNAQTHFFQTTKTLRSAQSYAFFTKTPAAKCTNTPFSSPKTPRALQTYVFSKKRRDMYKRAFVKHKKTSRNAHSYLFQTKKKRKKNHFIS